MIDYQSHYWNEAADEARRLVDVHGYADAKEWIIAQMDFGPKTHQGFWLQVWRELKQFKR